MTGLADSFDPSANSLDRYHRGAGGRQNSGGRSVSAPTASADKHAISIARLDPTTGLADSLDPNPNGFVTDIVVQADGRIILTGRFRRSPHHWRTDAQLHRPARCRRAARPTRWTRTMFMALSLPSRSRRTARFWRAADLTYIGGQPRTASPGSIPPPDWPIRSIRFPKRAGIRLRLSSLVVQPDGKILVAGGFSNIGGQERHSIARLDPTTGLADSSTRRSNKGFRFSRLQADGKILVVGGFTATSADRRAITSPVWKPTAGSTRRSIRISSSAHRVPPAPSWRPPAAGRQGRHRRRFLSVLGVPRHNIARLNADGTLDLAFNPDADTQINAIAVQQDGKILVGGNFTDIGGQTRHRLARLDATTGLADSFNPDADAQVSAIAIQADGKILAGGSFQNVIGGQTRHFIARLDPITGLADSFNPNPNNTVSSIAVQTDGKILVGGHFSKSPAARRATASPGSMPRPAWPIRSTPTRTVRSIRSRCSRMARF